MNKANVFIQKGKVCRFEVSDINEDEYVTSSRMATLSKIAELHARPIMGTEKKIDPELLKDGWTEINFDPDKVD
ncbi:hypothetical protein [Microbaculum sp. FT89]|uniref:hypothetical protein n=1 Tax=Microbaculum sp. FT89 TaxID=3447298 RepID=UPI003F5344CD